MRFLISVCLLVLCSFNCHWAWGDPKSPIDKLIQKARDLGLGQDRQWKKLLHYEKNFFGFYEFMAGKNFYLASSGDLNPSTELEATLRAFYSTEPVPPGEQHPRCRFMGRYLFLKDKLGIQAETLPPADCSRFEKFAKTLSARSVTAVFSSYYLNNPSSAFGHSFLRVNKSEHSQSGKRYELLDYGINYAAQADSDNPLVYAFRGIFGLFRGVLTSVPYYYKVREYNDFDARDLWEYDLNLTQQQVDLLIGHAWELGSATFRYYYFTQNCSYYVLSMLDAVNADLHLVERNPKIVIPSDTIKVIASAPGFVKETHYRPSIRTLFQERVNRLSNSEVDLLKESIHQKDPAHLPEDLDPAVKARVLDAEADYVDFNFNSDLIKHVNPASEWMQRILLARSKVPVISEDLKVEPSLQERPDTGHGSGRATLGGGYHRSLGSYASLNYRFALHDLLDPPQGYPSTAEIEMGKIALRYNLDPGKRSLWLDELKLFSVMSLNPLSTFNHALSWRAQFGMTRFYDGTCDFCLGVGAEVGGGWSVSFSRNSPFIFFLLGEVEGSASPSFNGSHFRLGMGPVGGLRVVLGNSLSTLLTGRYRYEVGMNDPSVYQGEFGLRWSLADAWALSLKGIAYTKDQEVSLGLLFYN